MTWSWKRRGTLNTAGIGDVLCSYSGVAEWRCLADRGAAPPVDQNLVGPALDYYRYLAEEFPKTLDSNGGLTADSVGFIMRSVHERDDRQLVSPHASGAGHSLTQVLEEVLQTGLIHGEVAALGGVAACWATGDDEDQELVRQLNVCKVRYRPADMGIQRNQLRDVFEHARGFYTERNIDTILAREPIVGVRFDEFWDFIQRI